MAMFKRLFGKGAASASKVCCVGHPVLRTKTKKIPLLEIGSPETQELIARLVSQMRADNGCGLAAPQIGVAKHVAVMEITNEMIELESRARQLNLLGMEPLPLTVLVNFEVTPRGNAIAIHREGCLSIPGYSAMVPRAASVDVTGYDENGEPVRLRKSGWAARIMQHEHDHMYGRLYVDHMDLQTFADQRELFNHPPSRLDVRHDGMLDVSKLVKIER